MKVPSNWIPFSFFLPKLLFWEPLRTKEEGLEIPGFWREEREFRWCENQGFRTRPGVLTRGGERVKGSEVQPGFNRTDRPGLYTK